jgi:pyrimidine-nucleoside phosphorylase
MNPVELIRRKRNGGELTKVELEGFIGGFVKGEVPDYQMSAFLMAAYFSGMTPTEASTFTEVMLHSGSIVDLSSVPGIKVDKHSTGGVGDKVSLILAPMVAACDVPVPMISGRGLGHTGGTLDKLESIPGFSTNFSIEDYKRIIAETGLVLIGQTKEIAPADKKMYALRDVTATVESIPLIAGSIMSKKLAEGIDALVLDVKTGNGAFMREYEDSVTLANTLVGIGNAFRKKTIGFITDMNQPLGYMIGNWFEVVESIDCLKGKNIPDLMEVTYVLGGAMVWLGGKAASIEDGMKLCKSAIHSGRAYEKFCRIVGRQGGDVSYIEQPVKYPPARYFANVTSSESGFIADFDTMHIGLIAIDLGAGRKKVDDVLDPSSGIILKKKIGDPVAPMEVIATVYTNRHDILEEASSRLSSCVHIRQSPVSPPSMIHAFLDPDGEKPWKTPQLY